MTVKLNCRCTLLILCPVALAFETMLFVRHGDNRPAPAKSAIEYYGTED